MAVAAAFAGVWVVVAEPIVVQAGLGVEPSAGEHIRITESALGDNIQRGVPYRDLAEDIIGVQLNYNAIYIC